MKKNTHFCRNLIDWYGKNARVLPWRSTKDPYKIWVSEVMLQQTTVAAVIPYYQRWIEIFPEVSVIAKAPLHKVLKAWQGLGYYQRARNLHKAAKEICAKYNGRIPSEPECLKRLPGFGPYTVGAVLSIAFDKRYPIIDANVRRVVMRQLALRGYADTSQDKKILFFLQKNMPEKNISIFNQALMELGALVCRGKEPLCNLCPVKMTCQAYPKGIQEIIPRVKKKRLEDIHVAVGVIRDKEKFFIQRRPDYGLLANLWEFPGGKIEEGEIPRHALARELKEELGCFIHSPRFLFRLIHFYTKFRVHLHVWDCRLKKPLTGDNRHKWVSLRQMEKYPMPSGSARILDRLKNSHG